MSAAVATLHYYALPWATSDDVRRFHRLLAVCVGVVALLAVVMPWLTVPQMIRVASKSPSPPLAHIVLEKPPLVIPPQPEIKVEPLAQVEPKVEKPRDARRLPVLDKPAVAAQTVADARERAAISGLLQFKDSFADMRDAVDVEKLTDTGAIRRGTGAAATLDRTLLTSGHGTRSAGVNLDALSHATGGVALAGRETTKVDAPPGTISAKGTHAVADRGAHSGASNINADARERSIEDIRRVFDSNKGAIFAIYNRALRQDPSLQGEVVLELQIDPLGRVLTCRVVSSDLPDAGLMEKIVSRIRLFDFGTKDVGTTMISYPVQFLPT